MAPVATLDELLALSGAIRYAAIYSNGELQSKAREGLLGASGTESDRYEELFVNPTLLTLVRQRGNLDCGGADGVVVLYGNFRQLIVGLPDGHVSLCFERDSDPLVWIDKVRAVCIGGP